MLTSHTLNTHTNILTPTSIPTTYVYERNVMKICKIEKKTTTKILQHKFHRYRCDNPKCMQIFTPNASDLKYTSNLRWWRSPYYTHPNNEGADLLVCSACDETQKLEWFWTFNAALSDCDSVEMRCKLYAAVERAETQLVEMNECKVALARQLVEQCLLMHRGTLYIYISYSKN